jgi:hypothetical protein
MPVLRITPATATRSVLALMLMAFAATANAQCAPGVAASGVRPSCMRDAASQFFHANRANSEAHTFNETHPNDNRWEAARVLGAASVAGQGAAAHDSAVAQSMSEMPWAESRNWIRNPPEWLQDIKDSRRRRAPVPVVHLWQSQQTQTVVALGVSHRGQPGLFISRKLPY